MHGYPDYYRGVILYGMYAGDPLEIALDSSGNLSALLKAMFEGVATNLSCDENGFININIAGAGDTIRIKPSSPAENIPVAPGVASGNFPIDIKAASVTVAVKPDAAATYFNVGQATAYNAVAVRPAADGPAFKIYSSWADVYATVRGQAGAVPVDVRLMSVSAASVPVKDFVGTFASGSKSGSLTSNAWVEVFSLTGGGRLTNATATFSPAATMPDYAVKLQIDGVDTIAYYSSSSVLQGLGVISRGFFATTLYDAVNAYVEFALQKEVIFASTLKMYVLYQYVAGQPYAANWEYYAG